MRYDSEHKERVRERVLIEAAKAVRVEGTHGIGVASVMARAGLTHGTFYAHFASKDDLVVATISRMADEARGRFAVLTKGLPPLEALRAYVTFYFSAKHRDSKTEGCPLPLLANEAPKLGRVTRERFGHGVSALRSALAAQLEALGLSDAEGVASSVVAEMVGAMALARAMADREESAQLLARSRAAVFARMGIEETPSHE